MDNPGKLIRNILFLRKHNIDTEDDVFLIGQKRWTEDFWTIGSQNYRFEPTKDINKEYKKEIYRQEFYLMQEQISHKRAIYDLVGLLGDMGGI